MKRVIILAAYVAIAVIDAALAQSLDGLKAPLQPSPPGWSVITAPAEPTTVLAPLGGPTLIMPPVPQSPIVIRFGKGGKVDEHRQTFAGYQRAKAKVEIRGPCYSACTLVLAYVEPENLCIAPGGFMAFHAIRSAETTFRMDRETKQAYESMPPIIRMWIDDNGGHENLPVQGYWTMYDRHLWAAGYPRCAP